MTVAVLADIHGVLPALEALNARFDVPLRFLIISA